MATKLPVTLKPIPAPTNARMEMFARLWDGNVQSTLGYCKLEGLVICDKTALRYMRDPRFIDIMRAQKNEAPGEGIWTVEELKRFYTRVAAGLEVEGYKIVLLKEPIIPGEDDYDESKGGHQWRTVEKQVPVYPDMTVRKSAADSLGKTQGAFLDKIELSGDLKVSVVDLLDDDLKHCKPVHEVLAQVVDTPMQLIGNQQTDSLGIDDLL